MKKEKRENLENKREVREDYKKLLVLVKPTCSCTYLPSISKPNAAREKWGIVSYFKPHRYMWANWYLQMDIYPIKLSFVYILPINFIKNIML